ncbi:MAG: hypothetical protein HZB33_07945, partial [Nitrospirae bacterium]|nr:hypothetical protein [Nitrospirota bacterium]
MNKVIRSLFLIIISAIFCAASHAHASSPEVTRGLSWLKNSQKPAGNWGAQNSFRDTAAAVDALKTLGDVSQSYSLAIGWMNGSSVESNDYLVRRAMSLARAGIDVRVQLEQFILYQNNDGGWGYSAGFESNPYDTAMVLYAFKTSQFHSPNSAAKAVSYLLSKQNTDGSWSVLKDTPGDLAATALTAIALNNYGDSTLASGPLESGASWIKSKQNSDGGFGNSPSTVHGTVTAVKTLLECGRLQSSQLQPALAYIASGQAGDGSWGGQPFDTAMALQVLGGLKPNLSISGADFTLSASAVKSGESVRLSATVRNTGSEDANNIPVKIFLEAPDHTNSELIAAETISGLPVGGSYPILMDIDTKGRDGLYLVTIKVDPDNTLDESSKQDNESSLDLAIEATADLALVKEDIQFSQNPAYAGDDITISISVSNSGNYPALNVNVAYYLDEISPKTLIGTSKLPPVEAGKTAQSSTVWKANKTGSDIAVYVVVDPVNSIRELTKDNNIAASSLVVMPVTEPNLTVSYKDLSIDPPLVNQGGRVEISALIRNEGLTASGSFVVGFYMGDPSAGGVLLGSKTVAGIAALSGSQVSLMWENISASGQMLIFVKADVLNAILESAEDDNTAFVSMRVLSPPDLTITTNSLTFMPSVAQEGDKVTLYAALANIGDQDAPEFTVNAYEGNALIGTSNISSVLGKSQTVATFVYDTTGKLGNHDISIIVDPDNRVSEISETNNQAGKGFVVFKADELLSERYISPNGDGIKDSTLFFFKFSSPQSPRVQVRDWNGLIMRTFDSQAFQNTASGTVLWDGLNDSGLVVDDGEYKIQAVDPEGAILQEALIVVDNNRSSFEDALKTGNFQKINLMALVPSPVEFDET